MNESSGDCRLKVLHVYRTYYPDAPGGVQEAIRQIALATADRGVESRIFTLSPCPEPAILDAAEGRVIRGRSWAAPASCDLGTPAAVSRFAREARRADVIHYHFPWPFADLMHLLVRPQRPTVMTYHSDVVNKGVLGHLYRPLMRAMLKRMDAIVATSPAYTHSSRVLSHDVAPERLKVIPLGIVESSYDAYREAGERLNVDRLFGLKENGYLLFLGALRGYKGLATLGEAAGLSRMPVVLAGDGPQQGVVRSMAESNPDLIWLGQVSDAEKMALLEGCRALVLPSDMRSEAFGMVLVEAAMCARPVISTQLGTGTTYVNQDGVTGLVVPPADARALAQAMDRLAGDPADAARMGQAARQRYEERFSGEVLGREYAGLYAELAGARA